jgi:hypothetical protein
MASTRIAFEATYTSGTAYQKYRYTIYVNQLGNLAVRDIHSPYGLLMDSMTGLPQSVVDDITASMAQVEGILELTSAINGNLSFVNETSKNVSFATPFPSTTYRVYVTTSDFIVLRITNKTISGFTIEANVTYSGTVGFDVFI